MLKLVQCWDDGVSADARLVDILRRHGAKASFNLNAGLHGAQRGAGWTHRGTEVLRLAQSELREVYAGFTIANHSLTHARLDQLAIADARREIIEGRDRLQQLFAQPVRGFVYPFGSFNEAVAAAVRDAGHVYARTTGTTDRVVPAADAMVLHPSCHFLAPDFWQRFARSREHGVFYFWGHSYEMVDETMWAAFEAAIARLGSEPGACWSEVHELFDGEPDA